MVETSPSLYLFCQKITSSFQYIKGDVLGVFARTIRFSENFNSVQGICGPAEKLWLDYSQVIGTLKSDASFAAW
jgi:hypothetical protein